MWPVKIVKDSDQIMFTVKFSPESLQIDAWIHCIMPINMGVITCSYIFIFCILLCFFSILLRKIWPWNIFIFHQNFCFFVVIIWNFYLMVCV